MSEGGPCCLPDSAGDQGKREAAAAACPRSDTRRGTRQNRQAKEGPGQGTNQAQEQNVGVGGSIASPASDPR
eukprot:scaffold628749_cov16-Prasinocladus_malaysianus.AAC.1